MNCTALCRMIYHVESEGPSGLFKYSILRYLNLNRRSHHPRVILHTNSLIPNLQIFAGRAKSIPTAPVLHDKLREHLATWTIQDQFLKQQPFYPSAENPPNKDPGFCTPLQQILGPSCTTEATVNYPRHGRRQNHPRRQIPCQSACQKSGRMDEEEGPECQWSALSGRTENTHDRRQR